MSSIRNILKEQGYPGGDAFDRPDSKLQFSAGGHYGIEVSSINNLEILKDLIRLADKNQLSIDRIVECRGIFRLPDSEIKHMAALCREQQIGIILSVGPRAIYDTGAFVQSKNGARIGYRLRGMENIVHAVEDVLRAADLGIRGFLVYDEGLLNVLNEMRKSSKLPGSTVLKLSVHAGCSNPASAGLFAGIGADTINPVPDLDIAMLSAMRQTVRCPLDIFTDTAADAGGLIRNYDVPEFIRVAAPVYLKCGAVSQDSQNHLPSGQELKERVKQIRCIKEMISRCCPLATPVSRSESTRAVPE